MPDPDAAPPVGPPPDDDPSSAEGPIADGHLHLWERAPGRFGWLEHAPPALRRDARWSQAAAGLVGLGVTRVVLVQAEDSLAQTRELETAAAAIEADPSAVRRADVVAWLPLEDPAAVARILEDPRALPRTVGVRALVHDDPDPGMLDRPAVRRSLALVAEAGLALDVPDAFPRHLGQATTLAHEVPGLTVVLDHLGKPPLGDAGEGGPLEEWERRLRAFAAAPGTVAKVSGLRTSGSGPRAGQLERVLDLALELFGPERLMIGSDWPIAPEPFTTGSAFAPLIDLVRSRGADVAEQVLHGTATRVYRRRGEG
ncbi:amidohydrolase family protein [Brachybacterium sp. NBEC-018]|uniref:amidohydrolase family protein n=1 Tax=Brachybacterium sp. NBEC-018 TaxID=2996004 RepID=UPI0021756219|nr:amidohydrolase family protein [Brachybacterium sp. NBEC-018]UVY83236.1 amidohydrolase family protein [Brachybacterium sp. NBEC-018]